MSFTTEVCSCGLNGQPTVAEAKEFIHYKAMKHGQCSFGYIRCPRGELYHCWDASKFDKETYIKNIPNGSLARGIAIANESKLLALKQAGLPETPACRKKKFDNRDAAMRFVVICKHMAEKQVRETGTTTYNQKNAYKCKDCESWHVTSQSVTETREVQLGLIDDVPVAQVFSKVDEEAEVYSNLRIGQIRIAAARCAELIEMVMKTMVD